MPVTTLYRLPHGLTIVQDTDGDLLWDNALPADDATIAPLPIEPPNVDQTDIEELYLCRTFTTPTN